MALVRLLSALLIALAVATAPVAVALASGQPSAEVAVDDCHGKAPADCPDCDGKAKTGKCPADGSKCCKLTGNIPALPALARLGDAIAGAAAPRQLADRPLRPRTPPPRH
jgi:hypothetical protein